MARRGACRRCATPAGLVGAIAALVLAGLYVPRVIDDQLQQGVRDYVVMGPQAARDYYGRFVNNTGKEATPTYTRFWMFNITNLKEVQQGAKPNVTEIGPYTYRTYYSNFDVRFRWSGMMSYKGFTTYQFEPSLSPGLAENDTFVTLNLPFVGALMELKSSYKKFDWLMHKKMPHLMDRYGEGKEMGLFMRRQVDDLLWGYQDHLLKELRKYGDVNPAFSLMHNGSHSTAMQDEQTHINTGAANMTLLCDVSHTPVLQ
ncbi:unnamed protein product [Ostreobium quekettii]|uniref:Uncharacterized protein n=1 Tax=Ostreobium quekettii TaxID=121088 RepID=A0A8S1JCF9_9CHLO|nr:unnamed protein product [Ostreobium quekettii]